MPRDPRSIWIAGTTRQVEIVDLSHKLSLVFLIASLIDEKDGDAITNRRELNLPCHPLIASHSRTARCDQHVACVDARSDLGLNLQFGQLAASRASQDLRCRQRYILDGKSASDPQCLQDLIIKCLITPVAIADENAQPALSVFGTPILEGS